jgi:tetratricopeptide (TPR) repeat protein
MRSALFAIIFVSTTLAHADAATAEALFSEGRRLMDQGNYAAACAKFEESNKADAATGTQLNLAMCWEKLGRSASAWAMYMQVANAMTSSCRNDRAQFAQSHAAAILPTLSKLAITATQGTTSIRVDGAPWSAAVTGIPTPIDPGRHTIDATAPNKPSFRRVVDVPGNAATVTVAVTF